MSFELAQKIADAVLYEGYVLYPYRASSAKNRVRFQFGVVAPRGYAEASGAEGWEMQTEVLVEAGAGAAPKVDLRIRCLQLQDRAVEETVAEGFRPVEFLDVDGELTVSWDEGIERELDLSGLDLEELARPGVGPGLGSIERSIPFELPGGSEIEELRSAAGELAGRLVRRRWPISVVVLLSVQPVAYLWRLRVRIENRTPWPPEGADAEQVEREDALRRSLVSAHTMLAIVPTEGPRARFVSLLDPPPEHAAAAAACANLRTWPVLAGPEGSRDVVLSSPIILYDHPAIAPESPGDLCDATEIDEILTLRIMTLTDEEKREARGTDPRARRIVESADSIPDEILERLHGVMREMRDLGSPGPADSVSSGAGAPGDDFPTIVGAGTRDPRSSLEPGLASWEEFLNPPGESAPEDSSLTVGSVVLSKGSPVRLRPSRRADSMDLFLAGREARVAAIYRDVEDATYVAVTLAPDPDDPEGASGELYAGVGRFFYFYPEEIEPLPMETAG